MKQQSRYRIVTDGRTFMVQWWSRCVPCFWRWEWWDFEEFQTLEAAEEYKAEQDRIYTPRNRRWKPVHSNEPVIDAIQQANEDQNDQQNL